jgi:hypothetical protein
MDTSIVVALIAAVVSLGSAVYTNRVKMRLDAQERERTRAQETQALLALYRDPLLRASFDLQSRLFNIVAKDFLGKYYARAGRDYAALNTAYVVAEYLGWLEILRREVQFLDFGDEDRNTLLTDRLDKVRVVFRDDALDPVFRVFNGEQRAIGEVMSCPLEGTSRQTCIGYARFIERQAEPEFARWFSKLQEDVEVLASEPGQHTERLRALQRALVDLIDCLQKDRAGRLPIGELTKLDEREPAPARRAGAFPAAGS